MFQPLHDLFKTEYDNLVILMDYVAERLRALGYKPIGSAKAYSEISTIKPPKDFSQEEMLEDLIFSYEEVVKQLKIIIKESSKEDDFVSEDNVIQNLSNFEKKIWLFKSFLKK